jgi:hypothetical protein
MALWLCAVRGATAAAVAFGVASWPRWAAEVLREVLGDVRLTIPTSTPPPAAPVAAESDEPPEANP